MGEAAKYVRASEREVFEVRIIPGIRCHLDLWSGLQLEPFGGCHRFTIWDRPKMGDWRGISVPSLACLRHSTPAGGHLRNYGDESMLSFSPESVLETKGIIGSDIVPLLDESNPVAVQSERIIGETEGSGLSCAATEPEILRGEE
ncbi:MAG: hypothetical protein AB7I98_22600 [Verrucomicrobiales bacterium]